MKKVGIYGGSFDPPTQSHIQAALNALKYVDELIIIPCGDRADKPDMTPGSHRLSMIQNTVNAM